MQAQDQKSVQKREQRRLEILTNDSYGRMFGEMERLFYHCGVKDIGFEFRQFLLGEENSLLGMMLNIEGYVASLEGFAICAKKQKLTEKGLPEDCEDLFEKWFRALDQVDEAKYKEPKALLSYLVTEMKEGRPIAKLPADLHEAILSSESREKFCAELAKNPQRIMALNNGVHRIHDMLGEQAENNLNSDAQIKFKRRPVFDIHREDFEDLDPVELSQSVAGFRPPGSGAASLSHTPSDLERNPVGNQKRSNAEVGKKKEKSIYNFT